METQGRSIRSGERDGVVGLVDARGSPLGGSCGRLKLETDFPPKEEQSFSGLYQSIRTRLVEFYYGLRLKLTDISRYFPQ